MDLIRQEYASEKFSNGVTGKETLAELGIVKDLGCSDLETIQSSLFERPSLPFSFISLSQKKGIKRSYKSKGRGTDFWYSGQSVGWRINIPC